MKTRWDGLQPPSCVSLDSQPTLQLCLQGVADRRLKLANMLLDGTTRPLIKIIFGDGGLKVGASDLMPPAKC